MIFFIQQIYNLSKATSSEVSDELLSLVSGPNFLVKSYSAGVVNGVCFVSYNRDFRHKSQNSGILVLGVEDNIFYGQFK